MKKWADVIYFEERFWSQDAPLQRSNELTPLYVERYRGPRMSNKMTVHEFWELGCVVSGDATLKSEEKQVLQENTVYLIPPDRKHSEITEKNLDSIWIGLRGTKLPESGNEILLLESESLINKFVRLWKMSRQLTGSIGNELDGMTAIILGQFFRLIRNGENSKNHSVKYAVNYLHDNFHKEIPFSDLAKKTGCSEGHFYRSFKRLTGETPSHFLISIRIRHACHLLKHTNFSLAEIATLSGFNEQFYFSRVFKKWIGVSPSNFRNN